MKDIFLGHVGVLHGDFGYSLSGEMKINDVLGPRVKNSMVLASASILIGIPIALLLGIITALWRDKTSRYYNFNNSNIFNDHT